MQFRFCLLLYLSLGLLFGCSTRIVNPNPPSAGANGSDVFHLVLIRPLEYIGSAVRLTVQLNGKTIGGLKNGAYTELKLPPGEYVISAKPGLILGEDFPPASRSVSGRGGETRCFCYTMTFGPFVRSQYVNNDPAIDIKSIGLRAQTAEWEERDLRRSDIPLRYQEAK